MSVTAEQFQRVPLRGKGTRYPARVIEFARRLHEDGGYTIPEVIEALSRKGYHPSRSTVILWCRPEVREAHNLKQKAKLYPNRRRQAAAGAWWAKHRRMRELRAAGLSFRSIAAVMRLDYGVEITEEQARYLLGPHGRDRARKVLT